MCLREVLKKPIMEFFAKIANAKHLGQNIQEWTK